VSALIVGPDSEELDSLFPRELPRELDHASSPGSAIVRLAARPYDIIIINHTGSADVTEEQLAYLRAAQAAARPSAKFIVLVARNTMRKVIEALRHRVFAYFSRPFDPVAVRYAIVQALSLGTWSDGVEVVSADPSFISVRLRCQIDTADRLAQYMKQLPCGLTISEKSDLSMAFGEMLLNAIEHGGRLDADEWVRVSRVRTQNAIIYHIEDPGQGFRRSDLKHAAISNPPDDPVAHVEVRMRENMRPGGFGLLIADQLVDEVIYSEKGNEVILVKHLDAPTPA
jgi:anti-sigma regulatory factor (Ser/Thr protein kinase)